MQRDEISVEIVADKAQACCPEPRVADLHEKVILRTLPRRLQAKVAVVDDDAVVVGSQNWSGNGTYVNVEFGLATNHLGAVRRVAVLFEALRPYMHDLDREELKQRRVRPCQCCKCSRPWPQRVSTANVTVPKCQGSLRDV